MESRLSKRTFIDENDQGVFKNSFFLIAYTGGIFKTDGYGSGSGLCKWMLLMK